jgi:hypothetical protein
MIRFVKQDYERLQRYLENYSLAVDLGAKAREELLKRAHRHSLAALQVLTAAEQLALTDSLVLSGQHVPANSLIFLQVAECFSDLISALFASVHGLYKPAHMSLRSAVENIVRGLAGLSSDEAGATTSVYRLFELAALQAPFKGLGTIHFAKLHEQYGELCLFTHSATPAHMVRTFALANFPKHDTHQLRGFVRHFEFVATASLSLLVLANRNLYLQVPPMARELLDEILPVPVKIRAMGGKA